MTPDSKTITINFVIALELISLAGCKEILKPSNCCIESQPTSFNKNNNSTQVSRIVRETETGRGMMDQEHHDVMEPKAQKPWLGYYDFLITEGSYKFWVVFQLFTIAILIYSAFAAIYYAKYTINDYDNYDDYLFGRSARSIRPVPPSQTAFLGLPVETYLQILNAIANYANK